MGIVPIVLAAFRFVTDLAEINAERDAVSLAHIEEMARLAAVGRRADHDQVLMAQAVRLIKPDASLVDLPNVLRAIQHQEPDRRLPDQRNVSPHQNRRIVAS